MAAVSSEFLPATRASRILGMDANEALNGKMITWAELRSLRRKRMLLRRNPMCEWVVLMEHIALGDGARPFEYWLVSGHALWALYARSRLGFAIHHGTLHQSRHVETSTSRTKTSDRRYKRNKAIVGGDCKGLSSQSLAETSFDLLKKVLLSAADDQPLLLGVASGGS